MNNNISILNKSQLTMSSVEISELVGSRHDKVKQSIERLAKKLVITLPPLGISENINNLGFEIKSEYYIFSGEQGKRDSIIVIAQLCPEYTARIVDRWQELEKTIQKVTHNHTGLAEFRKSRSIMNGTKAAEIICNRFAHLSLESQQVIFAKIVNSSVNEELIPLPKLEEKTYSAGEVGEMLGVSANKIGRVANELNLKTKDYGIFVLDKSRSSDKQVESFRYSAKAVNVLKNHFINKETA